MTEACAGIVERDDPALFATMVFAPADARAALAVVYAFDIELSRATRASKESMIPHMRLQWWRETVDAAGAGQPPKAHEVAGPLAALIHSQSVDAAALHRVVDGHEAELSAPFDAPAFGQWCADRFAARFTLAAQILSPDGAGHTDAFAPLGGAAGAAHAIAHGQRMAAQTGRTLLPDLRGGDLAALARGTLTGETRAMMKTLAKHHLAALFDARRTLRFPKARVPALLPIRRAERILRLAARPGFEVGQLDLVDRPFDGLRLAWQALRGRW